MRILHYGLKASGFFTDFNGVFLNYTTEDLGRTGVEYVRL